MGSELPESQHPDGAGPATPSSTTTPVSTPGASAAAPDDREDTPMTLVQFDISTTAPTAPATQAAPRRLRAVPPGTEARGFANLSPTS